MDISDFVDQETQQLKPRITKTNAALMAAIANNASEPDLLRFAAGVASHEQWHWYDKAQAFLAETVRVNEFNANLPVIDTVDGAPVIAESKALPVEPVRPAPQTPGDILARHYAIRRAPVYPSIENYIDAMAKQISDDPDIRAEGLAQEAQHLADCLQVKSDIPKVQTKVPKP